MNVEKFQPYHLQVLIAQGVQQSQLRQVSHVPDAYASLGPIPGRALTVRDGDRIIMCGGLLGIAPNMSILWALLSEEAGRHMLWLHRATVRFLDINPPKRIEASVEVGFPQGCRWLKLLGFKYEGKSPGFGLNGETHLRFGRVL